MKKLGEEKVAFIFMTAIACLVVIAATILKLA